MRWKFVLKHLIMNQDLTHQNLHFSMSWSFFKKLATQWKCETKQYYGHQLTNLIWTNILQILFDFITDSIVT